MRSWAFRIDMLEMAFVAYGAAIAGIFVLLIYGREEAVAGITLVAGGLGMAAVRRYALKRSAEQDEPSGPDGSQH